MMRSLRRRLEMPLLVRELKELGNRPRTYIVRFLYALTLFSAACILFYSDMFGARAAGLGRGLGLFRQLVTYQFWAIVFVLPVTTSGVITLEKERNALGVLMLTTLGPRRIVWQKLLSRLVPMFSFVLLSLPLMAIAFSFGGITQVELLGGIAALFLTCGQVGAISVFASCYFRTTPEALVASYVFTFLSMLCLPMNTMIETAAGSRLSLVLSMTVFHSVAIFATVFVSAEVLKVRAFAPPRNVLLELFRRLDAVFNDANRMTGGIILVKDHNRLPRFAPVAWRETSRKSLGTFRYLFRVLVVLELPILFACQIIRTSPHRTTEPVSVLLFICWCVAIPLICVNAASVISAERSRQTLDVLLTTPMSGRDIAIQKFRGVRRMMAVLIVPFLTIYLFQAWWHRLGWEYLLCSVGTYVIYLSLLGWFGLWVGLRTRSQMRAIVATAVVVAAVALVPVSIRAFSGVTSPVLAALSPVDIIASIEYRTPHRFGVPNPPWQTYRMNLIGCAALALFFRWHTCRHVDERLGRPAPPGRRRPSGFVPPGVVAESV